MAVRNTAGAKEVPKLPRPSWREKEDGLTEPYDALPLDDPGISIFLDAATHPRLRQRSTHNTLNLAGALTNFRQFCISEHPFHRIVRDIPIASMDLNGLVRHKRGHFARVQLRHRRFFFEGEALVNEPGGPSNQDTSRVDSSRHV